MIRTSYETGEHRPGRHGHPHRSSGGAWSLTLGILLLLGGCGEASPDPDAESGPGSQNPAGDFSASKRDSSLDAIERWLAAGRADAATTVARTLARRLPDDPHAGLALGRSLLALGSEARREPLRGPEQARILSLEAVEALQPVYDAWRENGPRTSEVRLSLGLALEGSDRLSEAIEIYAEADVHEDPVSRLHLGLALLRVQRATEADAVLREVESVRPDDAFVVSARAETALMLGKPMMARELADQAVQLDSDSWPIRVRRASILRRTGDPRTAVESLLAMDEESRQELPLLQELTRGCLDLDRPDTAAEAWSDLARARRDDPGASINASIQAAELYALAGQDQESSIWLGIARDLDPADVRVQRCVRRIEEIRAARGEP